MLVVGSGVPGVGRRVGRGDGPVPPLLGALVGVSGVEGVGDPGVGPVPPFPGALVGVSGFGRRVGRGDGTVPLLLGALVGVSSSGYDPAAWILKKYSSSSSLVISSQSKVVEVSSAGSLALSRLSLLLLLVW